MNTLTCLAAAFLVAAPPPPNPAPSPTPSDSASILKDAERALQSGQFDAAIEKYESLRTSDLASPELLYNLAVAKYRKGDRKEAAQLFREASIGASAGLAARSMFNQATALYADAVEKLPSDASTSAGGAGSSAPPNQKPDQNADQEAQQKALAEAKAALEQSIVHFRDAIRADPSDTDSRINAERAWSLLKAIREQEQEQEQQQQPEKKPNDQQNDQQDDQQEGKPNEKPNQKPNQKPDQQQDQQQEQGQQNDQNQESKSKPNDKSGQDRNAPDKKQPDKQQPDKQQQDTSEDQQNQAEKKDQPSKPEQQPQAQPQAQPQPKPDQAESTDSQQTPGEGSAQPVRLSKEDAERLLQMVRDKEKARRAQLLAKQRGRQAPVNRDW